MKAIKINRRSALKFTGLLSGSLLVDQWKSIKKWDENLQYNYIKAGANVARLCYNENPYGPSDLVKSYLSERMSGAHVYPFAAIEELAEKLATKHDVDRRCIVVTAGSREGLHSAALTFASQEKEVIACTPTYRSLLDYAVLQGGKLRALSLTENLAYDLEGIERNVNDQTGLVFLCNPNNPTGDLLDAEKVTNFCKRVSQKTIVFADEVYYDYIGVKDYPSMIELVKQNYQIVVARTFSKIHGLAGIRVGYLIAPIPIASKIRDNLQANTNIIGAWSAMAALEDHDFVNFSLNKNNECLEMIYQTCNQLGLPYKKAHSNFVLIKTGVPIHVIQDRLKNMGVLVGRPFPPLIEWCRVSTGKIEDVAKFTKKLPQALG